MIHLSDPEDITSSEAVLLHGDTIYDICVVVVAQTSSATQL